MYHFSKFIHLSGCGLQSTMAAGTFHLLLPLGTCKGPIPSVHNTMVAKGGRPGYLENL